jgi:hypothetical protein
MFNWIRRSVMKVTEPRLFVCMYLMVLVLLFCCCSEKRLPIEHAHSTIAGGPVPTKIWVQDYFIYRHGRYQFVKGHYRPVISKRAYLRRSVKGYTSNKNYNNVN